MQFYILMIDYGKRPANGIGAYGLEAVVQPELTRRAIVEQARDVLDKDRQTIAFVKFIDGNYCEDVTAEIVTEALAMKAGDDTEMASIDAINDRILASRDHARDLRKHGETV